MTRSASLFRRSRGVHAAASLVCAGAALIAAAAAAGGEGSFPGDCACRSLTVDAQIGHLRGRL